MRKPSTIGLIAAMPEEIKPFLRLVKDYRKEIIDRHNLYRFSIGNKNICLIESGMGPKHAATATRLLIDMSNPDLILNFGFCGGITPGFQVGDITFANRILFLHERLFSEQPGASTPQVIFGENASLPTVNAAFITTSRIIGKKELAGLLPAGIEHAVVEMETSAIAQIAHREKIPLIAIRGVSDAADEELGFTLDELCDKELNISRIKLLLTVARKPRIIPQLIRLSKNSGIAGRVLADSVYYMLINGD